MRANRPLVLVSLLCSTLLACGGSTTNGTDSTGPGDANPTGSGSGGSAASGGSNATGVAGTAGSGIAGQPGTAGTTGTTVGPASCASLAGTWSGYIESFSLDGSDAITLTLGVGAETCMEGAARFGDAPTLPPPTDPEVGYPAGIAEQAVFSKPVHPGFSYTVRNGSVIAQRVRLSLDRLELWTGWCALQKPVVYEGGLTGYGCLPNWGYTGGPPCSQPEPHTGKSVPVDCGKLLLCYTSEVCTCSASGCTTPVVNDVKLDLVFAGDKLDGSIVGLSSSPFNVHLSREK